MRKIFAIICHSLPYPGHLDWVEAGHDLRHQLSYYDHHDTGQQPSLQQQGLHNLRDIEQEVAIPAMDSGQLGGEKHAADNENLRVLRII